MSVPCRQPVHESNVLAASSSLDGVDALNALPALGLVSRRGLGGRNALQHVLPFGELAENGILVVERLQWGEGEVWVGRERRGAWWRVAQGDQSLRAR